MQERSNKMSELRTKVAAGVTILALAGLGGVALSQPQVPPRTTQLQAASKAGGKKVATPASLANGAGFENETADD
jgi:hypothetical protein